MAYTPKEWKDLPDETTPIQASDLNHIEQGLSTLDGSVGNLSSSVGDLSSLNTTAKDSVVDAINEVFGKTKCVKLREGRVTASQLNSYSYFKLTDDYANYDLLLIRVSSSGGGGQGIWVPLLTAAKFTETNYYLYASSAYNVAGQLNVNNVNEIGFRVNTLSSGWQLSTIGLFDVWGIKF